MSESWLAMQRAGYRGFKFDSQMELIVAADLKNASSLCSLPHLLSSHRLNYLKTTLIIYHIVY